MNLHFACNLVFFLYFCPGISCATQRPSSEPAPDSPKRLDLLLKVLKPYLTDWKMPKSLFDVGDRRHFAERPSPIEHETAKFARPDSAQNGPLKSNKVAASATPGNVRSVFPLSAQTQTTVVVVVVTTSAIVGIVGVFVIVSTFLLLRARGATKRPGPTAVDEEAPLLRGCSGKFYGNLAEATARRDTINPPKS